MVSRLSNTYLINNNFLILAKKTNLQVKDDKKKGLYV